MTKCGWGKTEYPALQHGDKVTMECNINAQTLSFKVNEDERVAVFDGIDFSTTFRIGIVMYNPKDAVKLLSVRQWNSAHK